MEYFILDISLFSNRKLSQATSDFEILKVFFFIYLNFKTRILDQHLCAVLFLFFFLCWSPLHFSHSYTQTKETQ